MDWKWRFFNSLFPPLIPRSKTRSEINRLPKDWNEPYRSHQMDQDDGSFLQRWIAHIQWTFIKSSSSGKMFQKGSSNLYCNTFLPSFYAHTRCAWNHLITWLGYSGNWNCVLKIAVLQENSGLRFSQKFEVHSFLTWASNYIYSSCEVEG